MTPRTLLSIALFAVQPLWAQSTVVSSHSAAELQQLEAKLLAEAKGNPTGVGLGTLDALPTSSTVVVVRVHTGEAERHQLWVDQMVVRKGTLILVTGGAITGEHTLPNRPGESRGTGIEGGTEQTFHPGDIIHIPANVAHWVKVPAGSVTTYLAFKEK
jgi:hypothetical protein